MIRPLHVVLSLGTGRIPPKPVNTVDVYRPEGLFDMAKVAFSAKNLGQILIEQVSFTYQTLVMGIKRPYRDKLGQM